ncbi:GSCFA domain-containing protein [Parabacteroides sp. PF5-6]|uniref:GSCFA domain-containing protein n=1 Tax=Parabacteroides sp. PF5-6 TaxID=1742403 RepID=UPI002405BAE8|nr:GSCFA domain-containing protein [Parabacteroides sp. PF5-6]MDF9830103.1 hypothetical protein [Parabacteroides sp. PF5-6]
MELYTKVTHSPAAFHLSHADSILLLGSCFAEHIGRRLEENKFKVELNPFGTLYNPASVASAIRRLIRPERYTAADLFDRDGVYHSFSHHSRFSCVSAEETLAQINNRLEQAAEELRHTTRAVVTFGSAYVYRLKTTGQVVANCHQLPDELFVRERLSVEAIVEEWTALLYALWEHNAKLKLWFTVSPIRHWKDGAHGNQLSKATLLLAVDRLQQLFPEQLSYFPAYEILMDELRDYRFYAEDMLHPSAQAIDYIWERFAADSLSEEAKTILNIWKEIQKAIRHKPFQPESEAYKRFIHQTLLKMEQLHQKFPYFDLRNEELALRARIMNYEL